MRPIDLTGKKFGKLTAIMRVENNKSGKARWFCKCSCGNSAIVSTHCLNRNYTKSCGCIKREVVTKNNKLGFTDHTGEVFERLTVIKQVENDKNNKICYLCQCTCGNQIIVLGSSLTNNNTKSCGCLRKTYRTKDLIGRRFGRLLVISRAEGGYENRARWLCECDCGTRKVIYASGLLTGQSTSCGCLRLESVSGANNYNWKGGITPENEKIRCSAKYKKFRRDIYKRDNYTCRKCDTKGIDLVAHHIESFDKNTDKRFDFNNVITLCRGCHEEFHSIYGMQYFNRDNLKEFLIEEMVAI